MAGNILLGRLFESTQFSFDENIDKFPAIIPQTVNQANKICITHCLPTRRSRLFKQHQVFIMFLHMIYKALQNYDSFGS